MPCWFVDTQFSLPIYRCLCVYEVNVPCSLNAAWSFLEIDNGGGWVLCLKMRDATLGRRYMA